MYTRNQPINNAVKQLKSHTVLGWGGGERMITGENKANNLQKSIILIEHTKKWRKNKENSKTNY